MDSFLIKSYGTLAMLDLPMSEAFVYYADALNFQSDDRLYLLWSMMFSNPMIGQDFPTFEEFKTGEKSDRKPQRLGLQT